MSPSQKDDDGQEWEEREWDVLWKGNYILSNASPLAREWIVTLGNEKAALEERVRVLEEALRDRMPHCYTCDRLATRVGYGANLIYVCDEHQSDVRRSEPLDGVDGEHLALLSPAAATEGGEGA